MASKFFNNSFLIVFIIVILLILCKNYGWSKELFNSDLDFEYYEDTERGKYERERKLPQYAGGTTTPNVNQIADYEKQKGIACKFTDSDSENQKGIVCKFADSDFEYYKNIERRPHKFSHKHKHKHKHSHADHHKLIINNLRQDSQKQIKRSKLRK